MTEATTLFKALADETRLRLLALLATGELCVCDLMAVLGLPQSTVSRHLATLRHAGLVEGRRQGVWMFYRWSEKGDGLKQDLLAIVAGRVAELPDLRADRAVLERRASGNGRDSCG